jgi:hypothetical protein
VSSTKRNRPTTEATGDDLPFLRRLLEKFARLLVLNGFSPKTLARVFADVCSRLDEPKHARDPHRPVFTAELAHVLSYWYTDPMCVDARGQPRPLPAKGAGLSVTSLVRRASPGLDPASAIATLVRHRALKRRGVLYVPTDRRVMFDPRDAAAPARGLLPLEGLLDTLHRNWTSGGKTADTMEATAINPAYPVRSLPALKKYLLGRGLTFLHEVDSTMRRGEVRATSSEPRRRVGVSVFLFENESEAPVLKTTKRRRKPG